MVRTQTLQPLVFIHLKQTQFEIPTTTYQNIKKPFKMKGFFIAMPVQYYSHISL